MENQDSYRICIFCNETVVQDSNEHIVPESLGNKDYTLPMGTICGKCNNQFSSFEEKALTKTMLGFERARMGIATKKGKAATAKSGKLTWTGSQTFKKNIITIKGITEEMITDYNPKDRSYKVTIPDFDKAEMATSKLLLKVGFESLYKSQRNIFNSYDFEALKHHLTNKEIKDWPFLSTTNLKLSDFKSIPTFLDKFKLNKIRCELLISEVNKDILLFSFKYSVVSFMINLINRDIGWTKEYLEKDSLINLYPEYLKNKIQQARASKAEDD